MRSKIFITFLFFIIVESVSAQSIFQHKAEWSVSEVEEWAENQKEFSTWHGLLLYQGSDSLAHHFISRVMDEWVWFKIKRTDLRISDERIYSNKSTAPLGYYYVDALKDFKKIKDLKNYQTN